MSVKIAVDTNLFIYVLQGHAVFGEDARLVLSSFDKESLIASEAIFGEILAHDVFINNETAYKQAIRFLEGLNITYVPTNKDIYLQAAKIRRQRQSILLPDAIHLASAWSNGATAFITNDSNLVKKSTDARKIISLPVFAKSL